jgi:hypothetical protein
MEIDPGVGDVVTADSLVHAPTVSIFSTPQAKASAEHPALISATICTFVAVRYFP